MKKVMLKHYSFLLIVFIVLLLTGCERVSDARAEFCDTLQDVGSLAADFKSAKVDDPVDELASKVDKLQDKKKNLDRLAEVSPGPALDKVSSAIDNVAQAVASVSGNTIGPVVDKIQAAGGELESAYQELDEAVCGEK